MMYMCVVLKIALVLVKNVCFDVKEGISELGFLVAPKHTAIVLLAVISGMYFVFFRAILAA